MKISVEREGNIRKVEIDGLYFNEKSDRMILSNLFGKLLKHLEDDKGLVLIINEKKVNPEKQEEKHEEKEDKNVMGTGGLPR